MSVASLLAEIAARPALDGVRIVGVDGPSGSGKSTVARCLAAVSGAPVLACDDFASWENLTGWWPRFQDEVLDPLLRGEDARYQSRDWLGDEFGSSLNEFKVVASAPLVIVEGVTCTRAAADARLTYRIWVEAPEDLRLRRGIERDGETHRHLWLEWMQSERRFFAEDGTRKGADLVVNGAPTEPHDPGRELVIGDRVGDAGRWQSALSASRLS